MPDTYTQQVEAERRQAAVDIAVLKEQVSNLTTTLGELREAVGSVASQVSEMSTTMAEAKGGWKTLVALGGAVSAATEVVHWLATHIKIGP